MVTLQKIGSNYNYKCLTITGLSTDKKPIGEIDKISITNGSVFKEIDTGREYNYDAETQVWIESISSSAEIVEGKDGITPMFQKSDDAIQVSYDNGLSYVDLVLLSEIKGDKGDKGEQGTPGNDGKDGEQGAKGDPFTYEDFTQEQLASLKGEKGETGAQGLPGKDAEITIDTELSKESNNAIANSAVAKVLLGGKLLKTILVKSDEEVEKLLTDLTENFAELTPVLMICGYDATENFGVGIGAGCIFLDSGDGDIENAIQVLYTPCEIPFTTSMAESLKKCVSFVDENYNRTVWRQLSERSDGSITYSTFADGTDFNSIYPRYIKMDVTFVGEFLRVGIGTSRTTTLFEKTEFNEALSADEAVFVHLEIEPGNDFWLCTVTYYGNVGTRTITKTIPLYSIYKYHISSLYLSAGGYSSNNVEVKNGYARNDGNGYLG